MEIPERIYFFDKGIRFECQRCGACCTGEPGAVYIDINESGLITNFLGMKHQSFRKEYLRRLGNRYSIREDSRGRCVFYNNGCVIYNLRPNQCRTYPFWFRNLRAENKWRKVVQECPGIGKGRKYLKEEILKLLRSSFH
ncbi:MAG: YkgJ family cysteine cluster protein [bacterium]